MDETLINYTEYIIDILSPQSITVVHVIQDVFTDGIELRKNELNYSQDINDYVKSLLEIRLQETKLKTHEAFSFNLEIVKGSPQHVLSEKMQSGDYDILIVGCKKAPWNSGSIIRRVAHNIHEDIMVVPEGVKNDIRHILVPFDFSDNSQRAFEAALKMKQTLKDVLISPVYILPKYRMGYYSVEKESEVFNNYYKQIAVTSWNKYLDGIGEDMCEYTLKCVNSTNKNTSSLIYESAWDMGVDFIMIGAVGKSNIEKVLFGSTTERFVDLNKEFPLMIIR